MSGFYWNIIFIVLLLLSVMAINNLTNERNQIKKQAVEKGCAEYILDGDRAVWRWKNERN